MAVTGQDVPVIRARRENVSSPRGGGDLSLLLGGALVSTAGSAATLVATVLFLRPSGPGVVAAAMAAEALPVVLAAPVAGRLVDRVSNRPLLVAALALQGAAVLAAALLGVRPGASPAVLVGCVAVVGAGASIANPTVAALIPRLGGEDGATRAFGRYAAVGQAGFLAGASLAGIVVEHAGVRTALLADAASYLVMAGAVTALRTGRRPGPDPRAAEGGDAGSWQGFRVLARDRVLRAAVGCLGLTIVAAVALNVADVFFAIEDVGTSPAGYGVVTACWPLAGVVGGWLAGRLDGDRALVAGLALAGVVMGAGLLVVGALVTLPALAVAWTLGGAANTVQVTCANALVRGHTPDETRGRVFAAVGALFQTGNLAGLGAGSASVALLGARGTVVAAGIAVALLGALTAVLARPGGGPAQRLGRRVPRNRTVRSR